MIENKHRTIPTPSNIYIPYTLYVDSTVYSIYILTAHKPLYTLLQESKGERNTEDLEGFQTSQTEIL